MSWPRRRLPSHSVDLFLLATKASEENYVNRNEWGWTACSSYVHQLMRCIYRSICSAGKLPLMSLKLLLNGQTLGAPLNWLSLPLFSLCSRLTTNNLLPSFISMASVHLREQKSFTRKQFSFKWFRQWSLSSSSPMSETGRGRGFLHFGKGKLFSLEPSPSVSLHCKKFSFKLTTPP